MINQMAVNKNLAANYGLGVPASEAVVPIVVPRHREIESLHWSESKPNHDTVVPMERERAFAVAASKPVVANQRQGEGETDHDE